MMETEGDSAPKFTMYRGVNSYTLNDKSIFDVGFDGINIVTKYFNMVNVSSTNIWINTTLPSDPTKAFTMM